MNAPAPDLAASLRELRDIHLPASARLGAEAAWTDLFLRPSVLAVAALLLVAVLCAVRGYRRRHVRRALRALSACHRGYRQDRDGPRALAAVSDVLRTHACVRFGMPVAGLAGEPWLAFLDAHGGAGAFVHGPGRCLRLGPYMRDEAAPASAEVEAVLQLAKTWIRRHP